MCGRGAGPLLNEGPGEALLTATPSTAASGPQGRCIPGAGGAGRPSWSLRLIQNLAGCMAASWTPVPTGLRPRVFGCRHDHRRDVGGSLFLHCAPAPPRVHPPARGLGGQAERAPCPPADSQDSGSLCFCFRWLLIWFKREFPFPDVLRLWEVGRGRGQEQDWPQGTLLQRQPTATPLVMHPQVLWTGLPGPNLHLLVACAILDMERDTLTLSGFGSNEILKVREAPPCWPRPCPWALHPCRVPSGVSGPSRPYPPLPTAHQ